MKLLKAKFKKVYSLDKLLQKLNRLLDNIKPIKKYFFEKGIKLSKKLNRFIKTNTKINIKQIKKQYLRPS